MTKAGSTGPGDTRKRTTITDVIHRVVSGNLARIPAGTIVRETDVARALNVGRVPARSALKRLREEGKLSDYPGRGYVVGPAGTPPLDIKVSFKDVSLKISEGAREDLQRRNWRARIYEEAEREVASYLPFGKFQITETAFSEHYHVSRTVVREVLTRLDRIGIVRQSDNGRWYAGPLSARDIRNHYEIRWLLEPLALADVTPRMPREDIVRRLASAHDCLSRIGQLTARDILGMEKDLHFDCVLGCSNERISETIYRSQLPMISTHFTFVESYSEDTAREMIEGHIAVFEALAAGRTEEASAALKRHLTAACETTLQRYAILRKSGTKPVLPYLVPVKEDNAR